MLKEAFNNCMKYASCAKFSYSFTLVRGKKFAVQIKDDGCGFDINTATGGNGLKNMKDRAEQIGFKFSIDSSAESGTTIEIYQN
jgi:signal transduction histidine kinase